MNNSMAHTEKGMGDASANRQMYIKNVTTSSISYHRPLKQG